MDILVAMIGGISAGGALLAWFAVRNARAGVRPSRSWTGAPVVVYLVPLSAPNMPEPVLPAPRVYLQA